MKLSCFTDEISEDLAYSLDVLNEYDVEGVELRSVWGKNISDFTDQDGLCLKKLLKEKGFACSCIGSPLLKCPKYHVPEATEEERNTRADQFRRLERCIRMAEMMGTDVIRVFSFSGKDEMTREIEDMIVDALSEMAQVAAQHGKIIALENEPSCYVRTGPEIARVISRVNLTNVMAAWDPANGYCVGEVAPYPDAYELLRGHIAHMHIKDVLRLANGQRKLTVIGEGELNYPDFFAALVRDGYNGYVSLETHYTPLGGTREQGTRLFLTALKHLVENLGGQGPGAGGQEPGAEPKGI